ELTEVQAHLRRFLAGRPDWGARARKTEIPLSIAMQTGFYDTNFVLLEVGGFKWVKEPTQKARDFLAAFGRCTKDGWEGDVCAVFDLAAYGPQSRNPVATLSPCEGIGVGGSYKFDIELLSEADAALL